MSSLQLSGPRDPRPQSVVPRHHHSEPIWRCIGLRICGERKGDVRTAFLPLPNTPTGALSTLFRRNTPILCALRLIRDRCSSMQASLSSKTGFSVVNSGKSGQTRIPSHFDGQKLQIDTHQGRKKRVGPRWLIK